MRILLTGGTGYIGSHTAIALLAAGHDVVCFDNLSNSRAEVVDRLETIASKAVPLVIGDVRDRLALEGAMRRHGVDAVIHFAGLKSVGEAVSDPLSYYDNNVRGSLCLIEAMAACGVRRLVFSSSATVYGTPQYLPLDETHPTAPANPYGRTKRMVEEILADCAAADPSWRFAVLRYFNPVGAHARGLLGDDPNGLPNNLLPFVSRVAAGRLERLTVYGDDYETPDGTGVRDYIHVTDLAEGHVAALRAIGGAGEPLSIWNLGAGRGCSVLEVIRTFERVNNVSVPYRVAGRRPGDIGIYYASPDKAKAELGWQARLGLEDMCASAWRFERKLMSISDRDD